jgi:transposase
MASSALLAHLVVNRFVDHQPWHRQSVIFRRVGLHIDRDVMSRWARKLAWLLAPLGERLFAYTRRHSTLGYLSPIEFEHEARVA